MKRRAKSMPFTRRQFWLLLAVESTFLGGVAAWFLWRTERLFESSGWLVALALILAGDVVTALLMQYFAPTRVILAPGEGAPMQGRVISGFGDGPEGMVMVRGERWRARSNGPRRLQPGDMVRVVSRVGLTLLIESAEGS